MTAVIFLLALTGAALIGWSERLRDHHRVAGTIVTAAGVLACLLVFVVLLQSAVPA